MSQKLNYTNFDQIFGKKYLRLQYWMYSLGNIFYGGSIGIDLVL
jgi:hypothetical protein